jgi:hypothetical protein
MEKRFILRLNNGADGNFQAIVYTISLPSFI